MSIRTKLVPLLHHPLVLLDEQEAQVIHTVSLSELIGTFLFDQSFVIGNSRHDAIAFKIRPLCHVNLYRVHLTITAYKTQLLSLLFTNTNSVKDIFFCCDLSALGDVFYMIKNCTIQLINWNISSLSSYNAKQKN